MNTEFKYSFRVPGEYIYAVLERIIFDIATNVPAFDYAKADKRLRQQRRARPFDLDSPAYDNMYGAVINAVKLASVTGANFANLEPEVVAKQNNRLIPWDHHWVTDLRPTRTK